jgi:hypothetical protein
VLCSKLSVSVRFHYAFTVLHLSHIPGPVQTETESSVSPTDINATFVRPGPGFRDHSGTVKTLEKTFVAAVLAEVFRTGMVQCGR